ncbi:hypothetical protein IF1G_04908 [Cordyceps javanica]|uniref:Uncharacterized protein n=1 Tax=Cordyceps javanica TaxID=43265 RepID=A0A545V3N8_9HYPO|nr:hypothetical protein IF1G_04908 [Cordyceps javanica]TQW07623.1 hypothetical protein IF2G_04784 [Cordyceps javanica]
MLKAARHWLPDQTHVGRKRSTRNPRSTWPLRQLESGTYKTAGRRTPSVGSPSLTVGKIWLQTAVSHKNRC